MFGCGGEMKDSTQETEKGTIENILNDRDLAKRILLDSTMIRVQSILLLEDSVMSEYLFNQLVLKPQLSKQLIGTYNRHTFLDSACYEQVIVRIERDEFINCCL